MRMTQSNFFPFLLIFIFSTVPGFSLAENPFVDSPPLVQEDQNFKKETSFDETDPLLITAKISPFELKPGQVATVELKLSLPKGFHAYEEDFYFNIEESGGFRKGILQITPLVSWFDKTSKRQRRGMETTAVATVSIEAPTKVEKPINSLKMSLSYRACSDTYCLFPIVKRFEVPFLLNTESSSQKQITDQKLENNSGTLGLLGSWTDESILNNLLQQNIFFAILFIFVVGIISSFSPCIFPMIPITLAILGHHSATRKRSQNFLYSLTYVLGIATTYSTMGVIVAYTGGIFGSALGNPIVLTVMCGIFLMMTLSMFGAFEVAVPRFITRHLDNRKSEGLAGAYLMGLIAGVVASPCVGPVLVSILTFVAASKRIWLGFTLLFTYALGLGMIFMVLGLSYNLTKKLPRSGPWMEAIKFTMGSLMLLTFYYYLNLLVPSRVFDFALGFGLIILGSSNFKIGLHSDKTIRHIANGLMLALIIVGSLQIVGAYWNIRTQIQNISAPRNSEFNRPPDSDSSQTNASLRPGVWREFNQEDYDRALLDNKPIIIDFWADWCEACHELENLTFSDEAVKTSLAQFVLFKFNASQSSEKLKLFKAKFGIQGLPTVVFIDRTGQWLKDLNLTQFEKPNQFLIRIDKFKDVNK